MEQYCIMWSLQLAVENLPGELCHRSREADSPVDVAMPRDALSAAPDLNHIYPSLQATP